MGGSSKKSTVGYKYYLGVQLALGHGPVDAVTELIVGERSAWTGNVTSSTTVAVDAPELFGGDDREGGVVGPMTICMGDSSQAQDPYLIGKIGPHVPAYIGIATVIFKQFLWSSMNPYFKAPWLRAKRVFQGWSRGAAWYPAKAAIGSLDMNPAHIIYQSLTDTKWGMGYTPGDIDDPSFTAAADQLYAENFGLSLIWDQQQTIQDFVQNMLNHINGSLRLDLITGKFVLKLIRDNYDISTLTVLDPSNVIELTSFQRAAWGESANEVTVKYTDREQEVQSVTVQDLANIEVQGAIVPTVKEFLGIRDPALAMRVAMRELNTASAPLAKITLTANRVLWDKVAGDVIAFTWPDLGINNAPFRIVAMDKGTMLDGKIQIDAIEDIFGLPANAYTGTQAGGWVDPVGPPAPPLQQKVYEAPYWEIVKNFTSTEIAAMPAGYGYSQILAERSGGADLKYEIWNSPTGAVGSYADTTTTGTFTPGGKLQTAISDVDVTTTISLTQSLDLDQVNVGDYGYIENEIVSVTSVSPLLSQVTVTRAVLDTVPVAHPANAPFLFATADASDGVQRLTGETTHYKLLSKTGRGTLALNDTIDSPITFNTRAERPFPPGNVRLNTEYRPTLLHGPLQKIEWSSRNRLSQTVEFTPQNAGNIAPEVGTSYNIKVYKKLFAGDVWHFSSETDTTSLKIEALDDSAINPTVNDFYVGTITPGVLPGTNNPPGGSHQVVTLTLARPQVGQTYGAKLPVQNERQLGWPLKVVSDVFGSSDNAQAFLLRLKAQIENTGTETFPTVNDAFNVGETYWVNGVGENDRIIPQYRFRFASGEMLEVTQWLTYAPTVPTLVGTMLTRYDASNNAVANNFLPSILVRQVAVDATTQRIYFLDNSATTPSNVNVRMCTLSQINGSPIAWVNAGLSGSEGISSIAYGSSLLWASAQNDKRLIQLDPIALSVVSWTTSPTFLGGGSTPILPTPPSEVWIDAAYLYAVGTIFSDAWPPSYAKYGVGKYDRTSGAFVSNAPFTEASPPTSGPLSTVRGPDSSRPVFAGNYVFIIAGFNSTDDRVYIRYRLSDGVAEERMLAKKRWDPPHGSSWHESAGFGQWMPNYVQLGSDHRMSVYYFNGTIWTEVDHTKSVKMTATVAREVAADAAGFPPAYSITINWQPYGKFATVQTTSTAPATGGPSGNDTFKDVSDAYAVRVEIKSIRDMLDSWQTQVIETVTMAAIADRVTETGDTRITEAGDTRTTE